MLKYLSCLLLLFSSSVLSRTYWAVDDYFLLNPGEEKLTDTVMEMQNLPIDSDLKKLVEGETVTIIAVEPSKQISDYWVNTQTVLLDRLAEYGVKLNFISRSTTLGEERLESAQLFSLITKRPDYLLMSAGSRIEKGLVQLILKEVPEQKVIVNNLTTPMKGLAHNPFLYAGYDHYTGGFLVGRYYKDFEYKKVLGICLKRGLVAEQRLSGFEDGYNNYLIDVLYFDGSEESILREKAYIESKIRQLKPDAIFSCASDISITLTGKEFNLTLPVNGFGGVSAEIDAYRKGRLVMVPDRIGNIGVSMADTIILNLAGRSTPQVISGKWEMLNEQ